MPLYEYECDACGHRFEIIQRFSDPPVEKCPACGGAVHKLQSAPAIQFKGAGFYITDYAKKEYTEATKADSGSPAAAAGGKEGGGKEAGSKEAGSKEGSKEGSKQESKDKTEKSVTPAKSSSASDAAPSGSSTKESSDR